jgi:hypothetical protein
MMGGSDVNQRILKLLKPTKPKPSILIHVILFQETVVSKKLLSNVAHDFKATTT